MKHQTIKTEVLVQRFGRLKSKQARANELLMLLTTGVASNVQEEGASGEQILQSIEDFILCQSLRRWIPSILRVRACMSRLCELSVEDDTTVTRLQQFEETLEANWENQMLGELSALVEPIRHNFDSFQPVQLDFFAKLHADESLIEWLLEHENTDSFNSLLQVCSALQRHHVKND